MLEKLEASVGLGGLADCWALSRAHPRKGATLECFSAEMLATGGNHNCRIWHQLKAQADDCVWQVDDLQLSTAPPHSLSDNLDTALNECVTDFCAKGKGLWENFVISTTRHPDCLDFPFWLPLVHCLHHALPSDHTIPVVGT